MDQENLNKILNSFNADPIKLQDRLVPKSAVPDATYFRPLHVPKIEEKSTKELLGVKNEELTEDDIQEETSDNIEEVPLPSKYSGLKGFYQALNNSDISSKKAKYALMAQMGLESGWGKKSQGAKYHNYGNITTGSSWKGDWFYGNDTDGKGRAIKQKFRKYGSAEEFFGDYIKLIENLYPEAYTQLVSEDFDIDEFSYGLRHGRVGMYAESPTYEDSLRSVYTSVQSSMTKPKPKPIKKSGGILYNY